MAWLLRTYGYSCLATHPYYAEGYSRSSVLPRLGFDETVFIDKYPCEDMLRVFVSDLEVFKLITDRIETRHDNNPLFIFGITMQNHGGYTYEGEGYTQEIQITGGPKCTEAEQYLSLVYESDNALEYLITRLEEISEDTIVLFFGDHMPKLDMSFYEEMNGGAFQSLDEKMKLYTVPFFIWANYDIEEGTIPLVSMNFLSKYLLEVSGIALPVYYEALSEIEQTIPVLTAHGYYSLREHKFLPLAAAENDEKHMLNIFESLQYNNLFDSEHRDTELFGQYLPSPDKQQ